MRLREIERVRACLCAWKKSTCVCMWEQQWKSGEAYTKKKMAAMKSKTHLDGARKREKWKLYESRWDCKNV